MIAAMLTIVLGASEPAIPAPSPPPSQASAPEKSAVQIARDNLDQAQQIYTQSCGDRAYGSYDDLCEQLSIQLRQSRIDLDKLERAAKAGAARPKP